MVTHKEFESRQSDRSKEIRFKFSDFNHSPVSPCRIQETPSEKKRIKKKGAGGGGCGGSPGVQNLPATAPPCRIRIFTVLKKWQKESKQFQGRKKTAIPPKACGSHII
ncbi:hypothetical protein VTO42DRAFT_6864 [Malbranchea cinnamomea]